jgi:hypothetical protein
MTTQKIILYRQRRTEFLPSLEAKPIIGRCNTQRPMMGFASLNPSYRPDRHVPSWRIQFIAILVRRIHHADMECG